MNISITYVLIGINVLVYIAESIAGGSSDTKTALRFGAQYTPLLEKGQVFRLFTAMFLHFGTFHLICNMYSLYNLGPSLEYFFGAQWFLAVYFVSGLSGNILTWLIEKRTHKYSVSAGASGAIFGLLGAYLVIALWPSLRGSVSLYNILYVIIVNALYGFSRRGINLAAHLGGFAGGILITLLLLFFTA